MKRYLVNGLLFWSILGARAQNIDYSTALKNKPFTSVFDFRRSDNLSTSANGAIVRAENQITFLGTIGPLVFSNNQAYHITSNLSIPATISIVSYCGSTFNIDSGVTLTLLGPLHFENCNLFTGSGSVSFGSSIEKMNPVWFGADTLGVSSSVAAIGKALAPLINGGRISFSCGTYLLDSTLSIPSSYKLLFEGSGGCTKFTWKGNSSSPVILIPDCFRCEFRDFDIDLISGYPALYGIRLENAVGGTYAPTAGELKNITIVGPNPTNLTTGILIDGPVDGNNDQYKLDSVAVYGYLHSGFTLGNSGGGYNIFNIIFTHCVFIGQGGTYGVEDLHGSFEWINGGDSNGNVGADFFINGPGTGGFRILFSEFEHSAAFLKTGGIGNVSTNGLIQNVTWSGECLGDTDPTHIFGGTCNAPSGDALTFNYAGPLTITNSQFGAGAISANLKINLGYPASLANGTKIENCIFDSTNTTLATLMSGNLPTYFLNNNYINGSGLAVPIANAVISETVTNLTATNLTVSTSASLPSIVPSTFTPILNFGGNNVGITYSQQIGRSITVNGITTVFISINLTSKGSSTGNATITGVPASIIGGNGKLDIFSSGVSLTGGPGVYIGGGTSILNFTQTGSTGHSFLTDANFSNASTFQVTITYF